ncbi:MAG: hypothetical protein KDA25_09010, partial [Phycisphaerales bacterium]|nr:hypothetical protein [Phycisphaerales bacterium]
GEALYAGGRFLSIDGVAASRVAKWDGTTWSPLGSGITGPTASSSINAMAAYDDGSGEALYVAGQSFTAAGGIASPRVARWNGSEWSAVGDGFANGLVWHLETFDAGNGEELYAFGTFTMSGTNAIAKVAKWDGLTWSEVGANDDCYGAIVHDDGSGTAMYVAGRYSEIAGIAATRIARLHACENPAVPGDLNGDFLVTPEDLAIMLAAWGPCRACSEDLDGDDEVGSSDLAILLANWS